jgi:FtsP/CotA-like multicopper oxidase with cupredoxin domain
VATFTNDEKNIRVEDGMLKITALHDNVDNEDAPFSSAKILTKSKYTARFGRIEARIKVPDAGCQGLWPAFWMLPQSNVYGGWPDSGEIDIMENANDMTDPAGTLHFEMGGQHVWVGNSYIAQPNFELAFDPSIFHIYALEWTPNGLQWFIDDVLLHDIRDWKPPSRTIGSQFPAPFDEEFYIILNLAVGGPDTGYTGQLNADAECIEANAPTMEVDYVRVTSNIPGCGNLLCDNEETCTSCSQDCGSCDDVQGKSALPPQEQSHCLDPFNYPEVEWTHRSSEVAPTPKEGKLGERMEAVMSLGHVRVFDPESGEMTLSSRGFNGMIPGPLLRMRPCHKYRMTIQNGLQGYPNPLKGIANTFKDPMTTSFHSWGPHLSSEQPSESPLFSVQPGEHQEIVYDVPCDHAGGTFFYHPQHQGSSALQTTGGAAGMLIFEDSDLLEGMNRPPEYTEMAEGIVMLMLIDPARERSMGLEAYDTIFDTPHTDPFFLANGCTSLEIPLEHAQWTRLRMAFVGHEEGFFADISPLLGVGACDVKLLAKDGVYLGEMPRSLSSRRLFFAPSSRVDIAIRCSQLGSHSLDLTPVSGASAGKAHTQVATFVVRESHKVADPVDLPPWVPCRPTYLMNRLEETPVQAALPLAVTDGAVNGQAWEGVDGPALHELAANNLYEWEIAGTGQPVHFHVNPLQLVAVSQEWDGMPPEWNMRGDWLDTILAPSAVTARMFTDRWGGTMYVRGSLMQSDLGAMAAISILDGFLPVEERHLANLDDDPPDITYPFPTTCERTPFRGPGQPAQIPGLIEAEMFDFGGPGLGYWDAADFNEHGKLAFLARGSALSNANISLPSFPKWFQISAVRREWTYSPIKRIGMGSVRAFACLGLM